MPLSGILFDKDGTLVDFDKTWGPAAYEVMRILSRGDEGAFERLVELMHYVVPERRFRKTSPLISGSSATYGHLWGEALGRTDLSVLRAELDGLFHTEGLKSLSPIGAPHEVAAALASRGLKLGIATNDAEASARAQAERLGLTPHMHFVAGYDSGYGGKPGPGMVCAFAQRLGIAPHQVALIGDSIHDLHAARAAGALAVAVLSGPAGRIDLEPHADHVVETIAALPALFDALISV